VLSVVRQVRLVVPSMKARGAGAILMSTSSAVKEPIPNLALSNVLRASVSALAKTLSQELAADSIRVNQIIPGRIGTDRVTEIDASNARKSGISPDEQKRRSLSTIPLSRYGEPDEFAAVAAFLLSDAAAYITGASVHVDGGLIRGL
jgi:3-oxoacyl-[acyl-carrier protein] reductase